MQTFPQLVARARAPSKLVGLAALVSTLVILFATASVFAGSASYSEQGICWIWDTDYGWTPVSRHLYGQENWTESAGTYFFTRHEGVGWIDNYRSFPWTFFPAIHVELYHGGSYVFSVPQYELDDETYIWSPSVLPFGGADTHYTWGFSKYSRGDAKIPWSALACDAGGGNCRSPNFCYGAPMYNLWPDQ